MLGYLITVTVLLIVVPLTIRGRWLGPLSGEYHDTPISVFPAVQTMATLIPATPTSPVPPLLPSQSPKVETPTEWVQVLVPIPVAAVAPTIIPEQPSKPQPLRPTTYQVRQGDTLSKIALSFGIDVPTLMWANDIADLDVIIPGQELIVPPVSGVLYTVEEGDTLHSIAAVFGAPLAEIVGANALENPGLLIPGHHLVVPGGRPPTPTPLPTPTFISTVGLPLPTPKGPETSSGTPQSLGFTISDKNGIPFWSEFQRLGGVQTLGYPITRRFEWVGLISQSFQWGVLQWLPDLEQVALVNILDFLHDMGKDDWLYHFRNVPRPLDPSFDQGKTPEQVKADRLALLQERQAIEAAFRSVADPMTLYGLPTSRIEDMGDAYVIRLQRAVLQEWKKDVPWARAGQVTVAPGVVLLTDAGLLQDRAKSVADLPPGAWDPQANTVSGGVATWYGQYFHGRVMANGSIYDMYDATTTAANIFPMGTWLKVTRTDTGASIEVMVTDTGAFDYPIVVDLSYAAFSQFARTGKGVVPVVVQVLVE